MRYSENDLNGVHTLMGGTFSTLDCSRFREYTVDAEAVDGMWGVLRWELEQAVWLNCGVEENDRRSSDQYPDGGRE